MNGADLRRIADRDWDAAARSKREYWADCYRRGGAGPAWRASVALLEHARRLGAYPTETSRADDLAHHLRIRDQLDRAASAFTGR